MHPSDGPEGQGQGQLLIKTVKLAFSVTNNVIRLKPPSNVVSPLEQALTQHGMYLSSSATLYTLVLDIRSCSQLISLDLETRGLYHPLFFLPADGIVMLTDEEWTLKSEFLGANLGFSQRENLSHMYVLPQTSHSAWHSGKFLQFQCPWEMKAGI